MQPMVRRNLSLCWVGYDVTSIGSLVRRLVERSHPDDLVFNDLDG